MMAIDMSKATDTLKKIQILDALLQAGCSEDELRLMH